MRWRRSRSRARSRERHADASRNPLPSLNRPSASVGGVSRQGALWILAGLAGITLAAGITWATSQLTSQHIGLSSEPVSAARGLAPLRTETSPATTTHSGTTRKRSPAPAKTTAQPAAPAPAVTGSPPTTQAPAEQTSTGGSEGSGGSQPSPRPTTTTGGRSPNREGSGGDDGSHREGRAGRERDD